MFCITCGEKIEAGDKFCAHCGARVAPEAGEAEPARESSSTSAHADAVGQPPVSRSPEAAEEFSPAFTGTPYIQSLFSSAEVPARKSGMPALLVLIAILMVAGAGVAYFMLRSSLPSKSTTASSKVDITILPTTAQVVAGGAFDFAASVSGTDNLGVNWSVEEGDAGGRVVPRGAQASGGKVALLAVYIAPKTPGTYHVLATSQADARKSAAAEITVTP